MQPPRTRRRSLPSAGRGSSMAIRSVTMMGAIVLLAPEPTIRILFFIGRFNGPTLSRRAEVK